MLNQNEYLSAKLIICWTEPG